MEWTQSLDASRPWLGVYLRALGILYAVGALVHLGNILGFGELPWAESPPAWRVADVVYLVLDVAAVIGLWLRTPWGIACFLVAAGSQLVLYLGFPHVFALTDQHRQAIRGLVGTHVLTLALLALLWLLRR